VIVPRIASPKATRQTANMISRKLLEDVMISNIIPFFEYCSKAEHKLWNNGIPVISACKYAAISLF